MEKDILIKTIQVKAELFRRRPAFASFVKYLKGAEYEMTWYHEVVCKKLDLFFEGKIKKMMILMPPQHGKSELATRLFPAYVLGRNPNKRVAIASYAQDMSSGFNKAIQRNIDNLKYALIFPDTKLNGSDIHRTNVDGYTRTEKLFEIVNKYGSVRAVGRGGPLTGNPVDLGIIDDLYKDRAEARSMTVSQTAWEWYTDVFKTRLHNDSQQLVMNTRWDENDLCGRLLIDEPGQWEVIKLPAIRTADVNDYDIRTEGEALWPQKHSLEKILDTKRQSEATFNSLYQQDPKPSEQLLVYPDWIEIPDEHFPEDAQLFWGLDFGFTNDPTVLMKCAVVGQNAYIHECCYTPGIPMKTVKEIADKNGYQTGQPIYCDHVPEYIYELRLLGASAFKAMKAIQSGIAIVKEYKVHYTASSINTHREKNNYKWVAYGNFITNEPEDKDNHAADATKYALATRKHRQQGKT